VIIIKCHPRKHRVILEQGAEVVDSTPQKQQACVKRLVYSDTPIVRSFRKYSGSVFFAILEVLEDVSTIYLK